MDEELSEKDRMLLIAFKNNEDCIWRGEWAQRADMKQEHWLKYKAMLERSLILKPWLINEMSPAAQAIIVADRLTEGESGRNLLGKVLNK